jgi:hypothetical protein
MDALWIALLLVFYGLLDALVRGCEALRRRANQRGMQHGK